MSVMEYSAHDILRTRNCAGRDCPHDAPTGATLCTRCTNRERKRLAAANTPPTLACCTCGDCKPDEAFRYDGRTYGSRRGRHHECNTCEAERQQAPLARVKETAAARQRRHRDNRHKQATGAPLTLRQVEILGHLAAGLSTLSIATLLDLSIETVHWHTKQLYRSLGVRTRVEAVAWVGRPRP